MDGIEVKFWIMNDAHFLYVAAMVTDDDLNLGESPDSLLIYLDADSDGIGPEGEDVFGWVGSPSVDWGDPGYHDMHAMGESYAVLRDEVQDGVGRASLTHAGIFFEFSKPLRGSSPPEDLQVDYGDRFGFAVRLTVDGYDRGFWPSSNYAEFATYQVASPPGGGTPGPGTGGETPSGGGQPVTSSGGGHAMVIAFSMPGSGRQGEGYDSDLWLTTDSGKPVSRVERLPETHEFSPSSTPDGEVLALVRTGSSASYGSAEFLRGLEVYVYEGGTLRRVTNNGEADITPALSPDGSFVVVSRGMPGGGFNLYRVTLEGSRETRLTDGPYNDLDPSVSPNGGRVVFASDRDGMFALYVLDLGSREVSPLLERRCVPAGFAAGTGGEICRDVPVRGIQPEWSPDGRYIVFSGPAEGRKDLDLYLYDWQSRTVRRVFSNPGSDSLNPSWTPDGRLIFEEAWPSADFDECRIILGDLSGGAVDLGVVAHVVGGNTVAGHPFERVSREWAAAGMALTSLSSLHPAAYVPGRPVILADEVLPDWVEGSPYRFDLGAVGGVPPYTWTLQVTSHDARLPDWLTFEGGVLSSDDPQAVRDLTMRVTLTDSVGQSYTGTYRLTIYPATNVVIGGPDYYVVWAGESVTLDLTSVWPASGGEPPYQYSYEITTAGEARSYGFSISGPPDSAVVSTRLQGTFEVAIQAVDPSARPGGGL